VAGHGALDPPPATVCRIQFCRLSLAISEVIL
jgi:hypothetical protein